MVFFKQKLDICVFFNNNKKSQTRRQAVYEETNSYINYLVVYITEKEREGGSSAFGLYLINDLFIRRSTL